MNKITEAMQKTRHDIVVAALAQTNGRITDAARILKTSPQNLAHHIRVLNLNPA